MDRLSQLRGEAGGSGDSTLDTTSPPSEAFMSANENSSKYFSLSDSTFDIDTPIKDVSLASTSADADRTMGDSDELISNISPIAKKEKLDSYKIGEQIEAANILSGGVDIFEDNDNSFDGDELVIDDNVEMEDKSNADNIEAASKENIVVLESQVEAAVVEPEAVKPEAVKPAVVEPEAVKPAVVEPEEVEPGVVDAEAVDPDAINVVQVDDPFNAEVVDPDVIDVVPVDDPFNADMVDAEDPEIIDVIPVDDPFNADVLDEEEVDADVVPVDAEANEAEVELEIEAEANVANEENTEVVLQIDGNSVNAIDIGNRLYLYRKDGLDELAAVQIIDVENNPHQSFKFLKVRDNAEGNLEVYEEIQVEVPNEPAREGKPVDKNSPHNMPVKDNNTAMNDQPSTSKAVERKYTSPQKEPVASTSKCGQDSDNNEISPEPKKEVNVNGKMVKICESRKSPVVGSFTPMTYHSTPNKEGKPLTKTMVDLQLHPNRHCDNVKTIEVHTDNIKQKQTESSVKEKDVTQCAKPVDNIIKEKDSLINKDNKIPNKPETREQDMVKVNPDQNIEQNEIDVKSSKITEETCKPDLKTKNVTYAIAETFTSESIDVKSSKITREPTEAVINPGSVENAVIEKDVIPNDSKISDVVLLKTDNSVVLSLSTAENINDAATSTRVDVASNKKTLTPDITVVEKNKSIEMELKQAVPNSCKNIDASVKDKNELIERIVKKDPVPNSSKDTSLENKSESVEGMVKRNIPMEIDNVQNITTDKSIVVEKNNATATKEVENGCLKSPPDSSDTFLTQKSEETKVETFLKSDGDIKLPLDMFSDVSSTSTNLGTEESKEESITLYAIDTDESVSLITPCSTTKSKEDKENFNSKISEVLTEISNANNTLNEKSIDMPNAEVSPPVVKDSNIELKDKVVSTSKAASQEIVKTSELTQKPNDVEKSIKKQDKTTKELYSLEKAVTSITEPKVKSTAKVSPCVSGSASKPVEKTDSRIPVTKEKRSETVGHSTVPLEKDQLFVTDIKSSEKVTHSKPVPEIKLTVSHVLPKPDGKPAEKPGRSVSGPDIKHFEKAAQSIPKIKVNFLEKAVLITPKLDVKSLVKTNSVPVKVVKPSEKAAHSTSLPEAKPLEISSNSMHKNARPDSHIDEVNIANKPSLKHNIPITILKLEGVKKIKDNVTNPKELKNNVADKNTTQIKVESRETKIPIIKPNPELKGVNNNHAVAVPFGKWTDVNRQEFLNKFKEVKAPTPISTNSKQIKNSNDLNRRDVLQKIDSQRAQTIINNASAKAQEKTVVKNETVFSNKVVAPKVEVKIPVKNESADKKPKQAVNKVSTKQEKTQKAAVSTVPSSAVTVANVEAASKVEAAPRDLSTATMASLIDKTIEDMIIRVVPSKNVGDESKPGSIISSNETESAAPTPVQQISKPVVDDSGSLDDIEMQMNELHGIPFVERPPHELPKVSKSDTKAFSVIEKENPLTKVTTVPSIMSSTSEAKVVKEDLIDIESEEEAIEHEPITGDMELNKINIPNESNAQDKKALSDKSTGSVISKDAPKKEAVITETDFDKFARRNSISFENCFTVSFDRKEPHNVVQTVKEKDIVPKVDPKSESIRIETKSIVPHKQTLRHNVQTGNAAPSKFSTKTGDSSNKNYQSKIHSAYQSLTAKHQVARPIAIIEDKPVKVVFVESSTEFVPSQLNVQGQELSPAKKPVTEIDVNAATLINTDSVDSDMLEVISENKQQDKTKSKHQRKQVLTPVEAPDLELIQPSDIGIEASPKKKRRIDDIKTDKQSKNLVHKKSYLLGRNTITDDKIASAPVLAKDTQKENTNRSNDVLKTASAIDNLVKAAELLENQAETLNKSIASNSDSQPNTPVKRGRGRPRKYPLPEGAVDSRTPSPQKKPKLIDAKPAKHDSISDDPDNDSSGDEMIRENWTMGKINENIVCPICNKLFRSENVVFKHVKHCTGVSPNRSESDKRSPRRARLSQESDDMDIDYEISVNESEKDTPNKRKSKESIKVETTSEQIKQVDNDVFAIESKKDAPKKRKSKESIKADTTSEQTKLIDNDISIVESKKVSPKKRKSKESTKSDEIKPEPTTPEIDKDDVIVIEDTPVKEKVEKRDKEKEEVLKNVTKAKVPHQANSLVCEFCGKTFRQLSYLVSHKLQHKKEQTKKIEKDAAQASNKLQVFSCEICKKEFRKLHHLVQHRIIHNPDSVPKRTLRKSSSEQNDTKNVKGETVAKQNEDQSAAFRCEPCDKSFRKLHHLVEHRETHDGINRQKPSVPAQPNVEKPAPPPQCEICKKTFRKLHHLIEHKEQHADTSSEKSDDKSVKSSLSTRDIIHECSLCYMVFPNEHSLNKHSAMCSKKKRQSKQPKDITVNESDKEKSEEKQNEGESIEIPKIIANEIMPHDESVKDQDDNNAKISSDVEKVVEVEKPTITVIKETVDEKTVRNGVSEASVQKELELKSNETKSGHCKRDFSKSDGSKAKETLVVPEKIRKIEHKEVKPHETLKKKTPLKDKVAPAVMKRKRTIDASLPDEHDVKTSTESDDDEVRYMLNPNYKVDDTTEGKTFMKVRASKRNSLQIERPNSNDLVKRRTSLQHPPKIPRLKPKAVEPKIKAAEPKPKATEPKPKTAEPKPKPQEPKPKTAEPKLKETKTTVTLATLAHISKLSEAEAMSTDSDDSDVKYSFPTTAAETTKPAPDRTPKEKEKVPRKSLAEKRKSLAGIAKRKSLGKAITAKHKVNSPTKPTRKRTTEVEHRCDCGQLFSSAALLTRHTSLAHTPPRIRRRRSPPPDVAPRPIAKPLRQSSLADTIKPAATRKTSVKSDVGNSNLKPSAAIRKSSVKTEITTPTETRKSNRPKSEVKSSTKTRRSAAHAGVPVPDKMKKLMQKNKK